MSSDPDSMNLELLTTISKSKVSSLKNGLNFVNFKPLNQRQCSRLIIHVRSMETEDPEPRTPEDVQHNGKVYTACLNICKHKGGTFVQDIEDLTGKTVKCNFHGWKLNMETLKYSQSDRLNQEKLPVILNDNGDLNIYRAVLCHPWDKDVPRVKLPLEDKECTVTYWSHACINIKCGSKNIWTDPWLTGPAFMQGWWTYHEVPEYVYQKIAESDAIYISHSHEDHLNWPTLLKIAEINKNVPIYVANLSNAVFPEIEKMSGKPSHELLTNINIVDIGTWVYIDENTRFMILADVIFPALDTCMLLEYKGHRILNTVDCCSPNNSILPKDCDVLLTEFAGGASGFPHMFEGGIFTESYIEKFIQKERKKLKLRMCNLAKLCNAKQHIPFAGYFIEAHPSDWRCKKINIKNSAQSVSDAVIKHTSGKTLSRPLNSGQSYDLNSRMFSKSWDGKVRTKWEFEKYDNLVTSEIAGKNYLGSYEAFKIYFNWVGFKNYDMILSIYEVDKDFKPIHKTPFIVDFLDLTYPSLSTVRKGAQLVTHKIRRDKWHYTMLTGQNWDKIYIGFQMMISRKPNVYHMTFWDAMISVEDKKQRPDFTSLHGAKLTYPDTPKDTHALKALTKMYMAVWIIVLALVLRNYLA